MLKRESVTPSFWQRFILATLLWVLAWPIVYFFKMGDITGPKAWFWIIGELNYPVVAVAYILIDRLLATSGLKPWTVFTLAVLVIAVCMPFYYQRFGFTLGVSLDARLF